MIKGKHNIRILLTVAAMMMLGQTAVLNAAAEEVYYEDEYSQDDMDYMDEEYLEGEDFSEEELGYGIRLIQGFDGEYYEEYYDLETGEVFPDGRPPESMIEALSKRDPEYGPDEFRQRRTPEEGYRFRKNTKESKFTDFDLYTKEDAEEYFHLVSYEQLPRAVDLDVKEMLQLPELPTGCETVSLTMALRYEGFELLKTEIAAEFLLYNVDDENAAVGFIGDPFDNSGAGCYAPALAATANNFFLDQGYNYRGFDISGSEMEELLGYVSAGTPVMVWATMFMEPVTFTEESGEFNGKEYKWYNSEHCVLLTGYDLDEGILKINDPLEGIIERDYDDFKEIYDQVGQMAVVVMNLDSRAYAAESDNTAAKSLGIMIETEAPKKNSKKKKK